jgi:hypothetical protein
MKAVKVQYTVKEEFAETNKKNIGQVMSDLRKLNNPGIKYSSYVLNDGKTFVHLGIYSDETAMSVATDLDSFKKFQTALKESQPEVPPKADDLNLVASAYDIF